MQLNIDQARTAAIWGLTDTAPALEIYADETFHTSDSKVVLAGSVERQDFRHRVVGAVALGVATFPQITGIYSTEDSPTNQRATYSAYIRVQGREAIPFLLNFRLAPLNNGASSVAWAAIKLHNTGNLARRTDDVYTKQQTEDLLNLRLQGGTLAASGIATLAGGEALVSTVAVLPTSRISLTSMADTVTGVPRAVQIIEATSFMIRTTQPTDEGSVAWFVFN